MPRHRRGWAMGEGSISQNRHTPLTASLLEPVLIVLISEKARHGYMLLSDLDDLGLGTIHASVVYRTLREMEDLGWIQSEWNTNQTQGPPRRIYSLTKAGTRTMQNWQQELEKVQRIINESLSRIQA